MPRSFIPGETWLVYAQNDSLSGKLTAHYCGRTRRRPGMGQSDEYVIASRLSWEEEIAKLDQQIPRKDFADEATAQAIAKGELRELDPRRPLNYPEGMEKFGCCWPRQWECSSFGSSYENSLIKAPTSARLRATPNKANKK